MQWVYAWIIMTCILYEYVCIWFANKLAREISMTIFYLLILILCPFFQNSIRHNLSLHNRFMRVQNEGTGKSSWWMLNPDAKPGMFRKLTWEKEEIAFLVSNCTSCRWLRLTPEMQFSPFLHYLHKVLWNYCHIAIICHIKKTIDELWPWSKSQQAIKSKTSMKISGIIVFTIISQSTRSSFRRFDQINSMSYSDRMLDSFYTRDRYFVTPKPVFSQLTHLCNAAFIQCCQETSIKDLRFFFHFSNLSRPHLSKILIHVSFS